ncbi:MAG TPA: xanthine dehydrogenase family protein subunit M [Thermoanaerobaculia bacterium]|nr:xanthine dehydrogenase family protein subunit M [Thermoanaerobaculia bacterium]
MFPAPFEYHRPKNVNEALKLLRTVKGARLLAGGHSLLPAMKLRLAAPAALVDIARIKELSGIKSVKGGLQIGAMTTHAAIATSGLVRKSCPVLAETAGNIGDLQVRNRGTIGGSIAHADPAADYPTLMLLLGATFSVTGPKKKREIDAEDFFVDLFTTALKPGEILTSVFVPAASSAVYLKHRHPASSFAVVGVAALVAVKNGKCDRVAVAVGGATAVPVRADAAEKALTGKEPNSSNIERAAAAVGQAIENPLSDSYASGEFRTHLATVMAKRALTQAAAKASS